MFVASAVPVRKKISETPDETTASAMAATISPFDGVSLRIRPTASIPTQQVHWLVHCIQMQPKTRALVRDRLSPASLSLSAARSPHRTITAWCPPAMREVSAAIPTPRACIPAVPVPPPGAAISTPPATVARTAALVRIPVLSYLPVFRLSRTSPIIITAGHVSTIMTTT